MKGNYNYVAPFYDRLSRIIFGDAIVNAQRYLVQAIYPESAILIVGGGTGWILEEISKRYSKGLTITYVDISKKMVALAKKKNVGSNTVIFLNASIQDVSIGQMFDVVLTPFVFDNFSTGTADTVFDKIDHLLRPRGLWLFADFEVNKSGWVWQQPLLKLMYFFFKVVSNIEADSLPDTNLLFEKNKYEMRSSKTFFQNFIRSLIYQKPAH